MTVRHGPHDRAKASEHAVFLHRTVHQPAEALGDLLAARAAAFGMHPVEHLDWTIEIPLEPGPEPWAFFEGSVRVDPVTADTAQMNLTGRFCPTPSHSEGGLSDAQRVEDNLSAVLDRLLAPDGPS